MNMKKITTYKMTLVALATVINLIGGQIALMLKLPIYLDSIGTIFTGAVLGPVYGMLPNLISGILSGITTDPYALYFAPVGMITGVMAGLLFRTPYMKKWKLPIGALAITLPGTLVSSLICAGLFGGVTSSGSSIIVLFFRKMGLGMVGSVYAVQIVTDYADRLIAIAIVISVLAVLPRHMIEKAKQS